MCLFLVIFPKTFFFIRWKDEEHITHPYLKLFCFLKNVSWWQIFCVTRRTPQTLSGPLAGQDLEHSARFNDRLYASESMHYLCLCACVCLSASLSLSCINRCIYAHGFSFFRDCFRIPLLLKRRLYLQNTLYICGQRDLQFWNCVDVEVCSEVWSHANENIIVADLFSYMKG